MVTISQIWMIHTMESALHTAETQQKPFPRLLQIYMDDCWGVIKTSPPRHPGLRSATNYVDPAESFNDILNSIHPRVKFTREPEENNSIAFLDVHVTRNDDGSLSTKIYRKPTNTNVLIKPHSNHDPAIHPASFKGEICRATRLCSTPEQVSREIEFALDVYEDNGHDRKKLKEIAASYTPKQHHQQQQQQRQQQHQQQPQQQQPQQQQPQQQYNLFAELPFHLESPEDDAKLRPYATLPFIPGVSQPLKRAFRRAGCNLFHKSGQKLQNILCSKNKTKPPPEKGSGIYRFNCSCSPSAVYVGETRRSFESRTKEHRRAVEKGHWENSGLSQHKEHCKAPIDWKPEILSKVSMKNPQQLKHHLKVEEAMWIRRLGCGPGKGLNLDNGSYVKADVWAPVFVDLK